MIAQEYKVLVVEDEPNILRNIIRKIEEADPRFKVKADAFNGRDALAILEAGGIDVVFTDIKMPIMDGMELVRRLRDSRADMLAVIISGYDEFKYAQEAIKLGLVDYLLKPIDEAVLHELLDRLAERLGAARAERTRRSLRSALDGLRVEGAGAAGYLPFLIAIGHIPAGLASAREARWYDGLWRSIPWNEVFPSCFGKDAEVQLLDEEAPNLKSVLVRAEAIPLEPKQAAERLLKALKAAAGDSPVNVAAGVGPSSLEALRADVQGLRLALERGLVMGRSKIFVQGQQPPAPQGLDLSRLGLLGAIFQSGNAAALRRELLGMFREWDEAERPQRWIEQALRDLVRLFRSQNPDANEAEIYRIEAEMIEELASAAKFPDLFDTLAGLFEELLINPVDKDGSRELIDEVCRYLETVLAAPVSIENLAARFNIGPASLARAFRKHRGVTPLRFLINLRIAEAKNLMSDRPELGIKDIAEIVGYPDQHYFSRIFKSMTGMSPSMFRESVEDKPGGIHAAGSSSLA